MAEAVNYNPDEQYEFKASLKKKLGIAFGIGVLCLVIGIFTTGSGSHHDSHGDEDKTEMSSVQDPEPPGDSENMAEEVAESGEHHSAPLWRTRLVANLWHTNVYLLGIALVAIFFVATQYITFAGWSAPILRIPLSFGYYMIFGGALMLILFAVGGHDMFHWTHTSLYDKSSSEFDSILYGKRGFFWLGSPEEVSGPPLFYYLRMILFVSIWVMFFIFIRKEALKEDIDGGTHSYNKISRYAAAFLVVFAVSSSVAAWDWIMSIDPHWFSTMFGWYVFASWLVAAVATITLVAIILKQNGYLSIINENHFHDLGKFTFGFSIFWTYIWFSQFLLYYYANIPEEVVYFYERLHSLEHTYTGLFYFNLIINFFFPFIVLMTRNAKRKYQILKIACVAIIIGHWLDFYLMIMPGTVKENGGFGLLELGTVLTLVSVFIYLAASTLSKAKLIPKNHPMIEEAAHLNVI